MGCWSSVLLSHWYFKPNLLNRIQGCFPDHWTVIVYTYSLQQSDNRRIAQCAEGLNGALCAKTIAGSGYKYKPVFNQFGVVSFAQIRGILFLHSLQRANSLKLPAWETLYIHLFDYSG